MKVQLIDLGLIKVMQNVDGKYLPESFCAECGSILVPTPREEECDPAFLRYVCSKCRNHIDKGQIDKVRQQLLK